MSGDPVVVVGGGVTGLAAAHRLAEGGAETVLLEAGDHLGGKVRTTTMDGFLVEDGPDSFVAGKGHVLELAAELGLAGDVVSSRSDTAGSFVFSRGRLHRLPEGLLLMAPSRLAPILRSPLLSLWGRARLLGDLAAPRGGGGDESLASFVRRRLGREMLDRIAQPLVAGIHAAEPDTMSLAASFPRFLEMERKHRSLILAAKAAARRPVPPSPVSHFASFAGGMGTLVSGLVGAISGRVALRLRAPVSTLEWRGNGYRLTLGDGSDLSAGAVILAVPAGPAARLLAAVSPGSADAVGSIRQVSSAVVTLGFEAGDLPPLEGHGFLVPAVEKRLITGVTFASRKWPGYTAPDRASVRVFIGGPDGQALATAPPAVQIEVARAELAQLAGITATPVLARAAAWEGGFHQYTLGHLERVAAAEQGLAPHPRIRLAGAAFHGIGLNECVMSGRAAADAVLAKT